jgi:peptide/nickel transport system permease protein
VSATLLAGTPGTPETTTQVPRRASRRPGAGLFTAIRSNRKAAVGALLLLLFLVVAAVPQLFTSVRDPDQHAYDLGLPPSSAHLLGTTAFGQDIYAQLIWGTRQSLVIAIVVGGLATVLSVLVGVSAAYLGGIADSALSAMTDVFLVVPTFPLIIVIAAYAGKGNLAVIIGVLVLTGWSYGARQLRAQALSLRNRDFLESARVRGERRSYIIVFEVLPTMTSLILANFLGSALYAVLTAAGLQFIGLGDSSSLSWGTMLHWAQNNSALQSGQPLWVIVPGLCIALLGASLALLNYAFDEISNPALRPIRRTRAQRAAA